MSGTPAVTPSIAPALSVDAVAFVAEAERLTNAHDAAGAARVYAEDASLELVTDGAVEWHHGRDAIERAWRIVLEAGGERGFAVTKTVVAASATTVVNRWEGSFGGGGACRGIESWTFGADGLVVEHRAETFLVVRAAATWRSRLRLLLGSPRVALAFARAERRLDRAAVA
ncbi:nuclear transport factor 2 family protein [Nocardioides caeni]|uniref:SnoaL-like domain-containing protein n=1 Tax=Nocardioides caeni TaxID=574700 RepID=A0A4S8NQA5_9ACTN|nr:nuclear transport factor 2 family protein [Nocardioides caeni]THV17749.1 hypothetical protein E9934_04570 [Nocardioides caeni]